MIRVQISECHCCGTPSYVVTVSQQEADTLPAWIECTSGYGLYGGGACCAPLSVWIAPSEDI